jgi:MFS family permease
MGRAALFYIVAPFLGPVFGPMVGAYIISEYQNWRYCMWVIMIIAAPVAVMAAFMSETSASRILYLRQKKQGASVARKDGDTRLILAKVQTALIRPFHMMLMEVTTSHCR